MSEFRVSRSRIGDWFIVQRHVGDSYAPVYKGHSVLAFRCQAEAENAIRELTCSQYQKAS